MADEQAYELGDAGCASDAEPIYSGSQKYKDIGT